MARTIAGICYVKVDGEQLSLSGNLSISMAEVTREAVMGSLGVAGCSETPVAPTITGTFNVDEKFPIDTLLRNTNMTVTAECANGMVFTLSGAFVSGEVSYTPGEGTVQLTFTGDKGNWS